ncbi:MAG TPA: outer membrane beta-barrel family protein [Puia sp.]|nr:outer membrane beta-barrel family protein [Puia sp.]
MRITALFLLAFFSYGLLQAQEISGIVRDNQGKLLAGASVALKKAADSALIKLSVSDDSGQYSFSPVPAGNYFVSVSHVSYLLQSSSVFTVTVGSANRIPAIELTRASRDLQEVQVTAIRPLVEVRPDRIILNVENTINAVGEDALDLLRKAPGITVDNTNSISLSGKNGVQVYVDGRPTNLSGTNLAQYLGTLQTSSIESIEIISNPSSRYEAAGSAGIINIRLKKDKSFGTNVTAGAGYNLGTYSRYNANLSFNHRDQHLNLFGDYTYFSGTKLGHTIYNRTLPDTLLLQQTAYIVPTVSQTFHLGLDYFLDKHSTLGFLIGGSLTTDSFRSNSSTQIIYSPTNTTSRLLIADNRASELHDDYNFNLNYHYASGSGSELDLNADYALYRLRSNQLQPNNYFDSTGQHFLYGDSYNILSPTDIDIYSWKADYATNWLNGRLGLGAKVSSVSSANVYQQYDLENPGWVFDSLSGDKFNYKENINAAYINYSRTFKGGLALQAGLRVENTNGNGNSAGWQQITADYSPYDSVWPRHYTDLFPSVSLTWKQWTFSYSRRIDRPSYQDLNPFVFKIDDYTFEEGNTRLKPQYADNLSLTWSYKYALSATLSYSHISDLFTTVPDTTDRSRTVTTNVNLTSQDIIGANVSYFFQYKWYSGFLNVNGFYALYRANFGAGKVIDLNVFNTTIASQHTMQLGRGWSANLTQYYTSRNIWAGTLRARPIWSLDAGFQKTLFNGRAALKASVSDIFYTLAWTLTSNYSGQSLYSSGNNDSRQVKLNFTYHFGNSQVKAARHHQTGAEDESKRVNPGTH